MAKNSKPRTSRPVPAFEWFAPLPNDGEVAELRASYARRTGKDISEDDARDVLTRIVRFLYLNLRASTEGLPPAGPVPLGYRAAKDGVGQPTFIALKAELVRCFNQAIVPYGRVPAFQANPFRLVLKAAPAREAVALTPERAAEALACPELTDSELTDSERAMLGLYLLAGVRLSEQMALTRGQVRFGQGLIAVDRAVRLGKTGGQEVGLPKGGKRRAAVMCGALEVLLSKAAAGREPDDCIWPSASANKPMTKKRTYEAWREIVRKAGLPPDMSPHDCRLTHVNWVEKLCPDVSTTTQKEHVGHAASGVTEINYTRPLTPAQDALRRALDSLVGSCPREWCKKVAS